MIAGFLADHFKGRIQSAATAIFYAAVLPSLVMWELCMAGSVSLRYRLRFIALAVFEIFAYIKQFCEQYCHNIPSAKEGIC